MDVSKSSESLNSSRTVKRKFMQWAWKWFYTNTSATEELVEKPDATTLISFLKSIGFQLHQFEKSDVDDNKNTKACENNVIVTIECGTSKMKAVLELNDVKCQCPNDKEAVDASFWSVSGTGSVDSVNKLVETGSNLLPKVDKETDRMIHDIIYRLLSIINPKLAAGECLDSTLSTNEDFNLSFHDIVQNRAHNNDSPLTRCYTQPEIVCRRRSELSQKAPEVFPKLPNADRRMSISTQNLSKTVTGVKKAQGEKTPVLLREKTWDKNCDSEPRPSLHKISTPVNISELCSSIGELSLQSDDLGINSLTDCLVKAKFYIEKALKLQDKHSEDDIFLKPSVPLWSNSPKKSRSPIRPPGSRCPSPSLSVKSLPQKPIIRRSVGRVNSISKTQLSPSTKPFVAPKLPPRGRSLGGMTLAVQQTVDSVQKKIAASKLTPLKPSSRNLSSSSSSLNIASGFITPTAIGNDSKTSIATKRYSTTSIAMKSSTLPRKKASTSSAADTLQINSSPKPLKPRTITSNVSAKKDINTTLPVKFGYSSKK